MIRDIGFAPKANHPPPLLTDNQGSMRLVRNEPVNRRKKHNGVCFHNTRNAVHDKYIKLDYQCANEMVAVIMTKPLGRISVR